MPVDGARKEVTLQDGFVQVMPPPLSSCLVDIGPRRRKDLLPGPFTLSVRVLHSKRARQGDTAAPGRQVRFVLHLHLP